MKYFVFILSALTLNSCNHQSERIKNLTSKDSLILSIQGSWKGFKGVLIWNIRPDSIFYYSENRSYYYFVHNNDIIVLYKYGPYKLKNIRVRNDTIFFKTGDLNAIAFRSEDTDPIKTKKDYFKNQLEDETHTDSIKNKILGKWGYEYKEGLFSWVFTKDSVFYTQLNKRYFYLQHDNNIVVLSDENPSIMKDISVKYDTLSFKTPDNVIIKAHKIKQ